MLWTALKNFFYPTEQNHYQPQALSDRMITVYILAFLLIKALFSWEILLTRQSDLFAAISAQKIITLTNQIRQEYGLPPLKVNFALENAAKAKAEDMLAKHYFSHYSPTGIAPWHWIDKSGYYYHYAGENLAVNFLDSEEVIQSWLNSPSHRENLLNRHYQDIGVAVVRGDVLGNGQEEILVVQMLGSSLSKPPVVSAKVKVAEASTLQNSDKSISAPSTSPTSSSTTSTTKPIVVTTKEATPPLMVYRPASNTSEIVTSVSSSSSSIPIKSKIKVVSAGFISTRQKLDLLNKIIAISLALLGTLTLIEITIAQQKRETNLVFSEMVARSALIILISVAFFYLKIDILIGKIMIT